MLVETQNEAVALGPKAALGLLDSVSSSQLTDDPLRDVNTHAALSPTPTSVTPGGVLV